LSSVSHNLAALSEARGNDWLFGGEKIDIIWQAGKMLIFHGSGVPDLPGSSLATRSDRGLPTPHGVCVFDVSFSFFSWVLLPICV